MNGTREAQMYEDALDANLITLIENGKVKEMPLSQGKVALVNVKDYEWLSQWKWYANERGYTYYALRSAWGNNHPNPIFMHRAILGLTKGDGLICDHIDRNGLNNCRDNLRIVTPSISMRNRKFNRNNTSGYKGVSWNKNAQKWIVNIGMDCKNIYCGLYSDAITAACVYDEKARQFFGDNAILNFPDAHS